MAVEVGRSVRLAADRVAGRVRLGGVIAVEGAARGAVAARVAPGCYRRGEPGVEGPLLLEAREDGDAVVLEVWGAAGTPGEVVEAALQAARGWAGLLDRPEEARPVLEAHPLVAEVVRRAGLPRLSRLPRVGEAFGRAVLEQLVQGPEARRSIAQLVTRCGTPAGGGVWAWPTARELGRMPAWELRSCGVSLRSVRALHGAALLDAKLEALTAAGDWERLDVALCSVPGAGAWTSAETRVRLGDGDAVSVGDYHLPAVVGYILGEGARGSGRRRADYTDAEMLTLLEPFAPHRGRVIRLLESAAARGFVALPPRRAPRAALSAHRYW